MGGQYFPPQHEPEMNQNELQTGLFGCVCVMIVHDSWLPTNHPEPLVFRSMPISSHESSRVNTKRSYPSWKTIR